MGQIAVGHTRQSVRPMSQSLLGRMKLISREYREAARTTHLFVGLRQGESLTKEDFFSFLPREQKNTLQKLAAKNFRGDEGEIKSFFFTDRSPKQVALFGMGERRAWNERKATLLARRMVRHAKQEKIEAFATPLLVGERTGATDIRWSARMFAQNAFMADFEFNRYRQKPKGGWPEVKTVFLGAHKKYLKEIGAGLREGSIIGEEVNKTRTLANTPGSDMTPATLARSAVAAGKEAGFKVRVMDEPEIRRLGMGGVLGVSRGSDEKPQFIICQYRNGPAGQKPLVLVGKGVTFDTGGINLKPGQYMYEMHMDMSGGAAVIHGIAAAARLKLPITIVGLIPAVENMPSGSSYRPGDLLKSMSGKIIEVLDTDAEGRVILADALAYALRYRPGLIVDIATLTGAAHVALGNYCSAVFTNRASLTDKLVSIGEASGDYVWPLPLWDEYLADIKGTFGDLANAGKTDRYGGAIHGAKFLEQFVNRTPWLHLDIAPKMTTTESEQLAKGASGVGVRYIVELAMTYPKLETPQE